MSELAAVATPVTPPVHPLVGTLSALHHFRVYADVAIVVIVLTVIGWVMAAFAMRQYRARVPYWV